MFMTNSTQKSFEIVIEIIFDKQPCVSIASMRTLQFNVDAWSLE